MFVYFYIHTGTAIGDGLKAAFAGEDAELVIEARDIIGNQRVVGDDPFEVEIEGPSTPQVCVLTRESQRETWLERGGERERDRETERQSEREKEREREREREGLCVCVCVCV